MLRHIALVPVVMAAILPTMALAGTFDFSAGRLGLRFDDQTGALLRITCDGAEIASAGADVSPVTFGIGERDKVQWAEQMGLKRRLAARNEPAAGTIELTIEAGDYELLERYILHADSPRLDRSVRLTNRGQQTVKLRGMAFVMPGVRAVGDGFYRMPGVWPPQAHPFSQMQPQRKSYARGSIAPAVAQLDGGRQTLLWMSYTDESPSLEITEAAQQIWVRQVVDVAGFLRPGQPQEIGFVTMQVAEGDYWTALPRLWDWMDAVGLAVPADRPEWVRDVVLYSFHPGGTIGSNWKDLGGFAAATTKLLPTLPRLGVNAIWVMPIEHTSPYWPNDYYRFMEGLGSGEEYQAMVDRAHELKMRVLQDIVPHGGSPQAVHNVEHPEFMLVREDGTNLDYWLNDFAWPQWQQFIGGVADHYVRRYGIDGYRIDACFGSREPNWNPDIPYPRASMAGLWGGLGMVRTIRQSTRQANPNAAVLAEVESTRHLAVSDAMYDFSLCYQVAHEWRLLPPEQFVAMLRDYFEEQRHAEPRGTVRMRHVESHDSLRSQLWYGVDGMRAMYALSAWIEGIPLLYQGQEIGHASELAWINKIRAERPELRRGEALYRAVECDQPAVFTCLRRLGERQSVVAINFGAEPVTATLRWPGGNGVVKLAPLEYAVLPRASEASGSTAPAAPPAAKGIDWFVDTIEGRLADTWMGSRTSGVVEPNGPTYWRPQGEGILWRHDMIPLHPTAGAVGIRGTDGMWLITRFKGDVPAGLRLVEQRRPDGTAFGLTLEALEGVNVRPIKRSAVPPVPERTSAWGNVRLRCIGPDYIVSNNHYTVVLRRQGGVVRSLRDSSGRELAGGNDVYGDQEFFAVTDSPRIEASADVEAGARIWHDGNGLHLAFEGQLRGVPRFALKSPPVLYRLEYVFGDAAEFRQTWALCSPEGFADKQAFLSWIVQPSEQDQALRLRLRQRDKLVLDKPLPPSTQSGRVGQTADGPAPDQVELFSGERVVLRMHDLTTPQHAAGGASTAPVLPGLRTRVFADAGLVFVTLLDGADSSMPAGQWQEFGVTWQIPGR